MKRKILKNENYNKIVKGKKSPEKGTSLINVEPKPRHSPEIPFTCNNSPIADLVSK